jgi:subtilisin
MMCAKFRDLSRIGLAAMLLSFAAVHVASAAAAPAGGSPDVAAEATERVDVFIAFASNPGPAEQALVRGVGGQIRYTYTLVPAIAASVPQAAIAGLLATPGVVRVEPDGEVYALDYAGELDDTWGVKRIGAGVLHGQENGPEFGTGIRVAVIDSGIDDEHREFAHPGSIGAGYNFVANNADPYDDNGHGTHVAGTIMAARDGAGVVGVAPEVTVFALKVLNASGSGSWSNVVAALEWTVSNGMQITNNSYGSGQNPGTTVRDAFANSAAVGILHVAAAGNSGNCGGNNDSVGWPAKYETVIAVGATNSRDVRPCFSSTGPALELAAPGVSIKSTVPGGGYDTWNGTSMASPHVAGVAALMLGANAGLSISETRDLMAATADDLGDDGRDPHYGHGLVNAVAAVGAAVDGLPDEDQEADGGGDGGGGGNQESSGTAFVAAVDYTTNGGRHGDKHLTSTVSIVDDEAAPLSGVTVSVEILRNGSLYGTGSATTGSSGTVGFEIKNAPSGCYSTVVTSLSTNPDWDRQNTPSNEHCR